MNMFIHFVNREKELAFLEEQFSKKPCFIVLYGRRRVGKSELLKKFSRGKKTIFFTATQEVEKELMEDFSKELAVFFNDNTLKIQTFSKFKQTLEYLKEKELKNTVLIIDEFPYLVDANKAAPSLLQKHWDNDFKHSGPSVILCGSSIGSMETEVLGRKSPLYGRRTGQWKLEPLKFRDFRKFFPKTPIERTIEFHSITGGVPLYILEFDQKKTAHENAKKSIATRGAILYQEAEILLKEELREPKTYFSLLKELSGGKNSLNDLANATGIEITALGRYINTLIELGLIEKISPATAETKTKKTMYKLTDNYFSFWFRFIHPFRKDLDSFDFKKFDEFFLQNFNSYAGKKFEEICIEWLGLKKPFEFTRIGNWWGNYRENDERKSVEIDIVAVNEKTKEILFAECKWKTNAKAQKILGKLKQKAKLVDWNSGNRKEYFAVFAKAFNKKDQTEGTWLVDLKDMEKTFKAEQNR